MYLLNIIISITLGATLMVGCAQETPVQEESKDVKPTAAASANKAAAVQDAPGQPEESQAKGVTHRSVRRIEIGTSGDMPSFDLSELTVEANSVVRIVFNNRAAVDSEIQHDVVVLKPGTEDAFIKRLAKAGYVLAKLSGDPAILGSSHTIEPGASGELMFRAGDPGNYPYICTMPGHAEIMNMKGVIKVVAK